MKNSFPSATPGQKLEIDILMNELGVKTEQMMELAGRDIARLCAKLSKGPILIFCGKGHNGGDGLVAAKHLLNLNIPSAVVLVEPEKSFTGIEKRHLKVLKHIGAGVFNFDNPELHKVAEQADLLVDALVGYRLNTDPRSPIKEAITFINESQKKVLSIDLPTGIDGLTGTKHTPYIKANYTIAMGIPLKGCNKKNSGKIFVNDIGIPDTVYKAVKLDEKPRFVNNTIIKL